VTKYLTLLALLHLNLAGACAGAFPLSQVLSTWLLFLPLIVA